MIDERARWKCKGCDGECVVSCYSNPCPPITVPCGCIYGGMGVVEWVRLDES